jgi:hypothetical protein
VITTTGWQHVAVTYDDGSTANNPLLYLGGASQSITEEFTPTGTRGDDSTHNFFIGSTTTADRTFNGRIAGVGAATTILSGAEILEIANGPEPTNSVAPVVSGTETEGETLSCTTGTWGLPSPFSGGTNGTITYSYQWTRSDDGSGAGEADISGATSSTYLLDAADVAKYIRCRVRGTNDGGFDSTADTNSNFTGAIGVAATGNRRRRALICGRAA